MIVWGGTNYNGTTQYFGDGGRYQPATDSWTPLPVAGAPSARTDHAAVWTGSEMILWGGSAGTGDLSNGSRYNPAANRWKAVTTFAAPPASSNHSTVWTGSEMIEWVGCSSINYSYIPD